MRAAPWSEFHKRWAKLQPPLRPNDEIVAALRAAIAGHDTRALLLGVTPELSAIATDTVAVDWSETMLAAVWPGNGAHRHAVQANWLRLPFSGQRFSAVIGDGSLNCLVYPDDYRRIFAELPRVLMPGAALAIRIYATPAATETLEDLRKATMTGHVGRIDALKWRLANALCQEDGDANLGVAAIYDAFQELFPDRDGLAKAAHWTKDHIDQIDRFASLPDVFSFPTEAQLLAVLPPHFAQARFLPSGSYELAERCPILSVEFRP